MFCVMGVEEQSFLKPGWVFVAHRRVNQSLSPNRFTGKYSKGYKEVMGTGRKMEKQTIC